MLAYPREKTAVYQRGVVACRKCGAPIYLHKLNMLADEFSVRCQHCGQRDFHMKRSIVIEDAPERRRKPRRN